MGKTNKNRKKLLSASVRVYECASVRVCECASVRVCECASVRVLGSNKFHNKSVWLKNVSKLQQKNDKSKAFNIFLTLP